MHKRMAAMLSCGFMSFFVLGAAGAASDVYLETGSLTAFQDVTCTQDQMASEYSVSGTPECSVHRVSTTYHRQKMATLLYRDHLKED